MGISQRSIASVFEVSDATPNNWANNKSFPNLDLFSKICKYLDTDPTTMLWGDVPDVANAVVGPVENQVKDVILGYKVQVQKNNGGINTQQTNCTECLTELDQIKAELAATKEQLIKVQSAYIKLLTGGGDVG